MAYLLNYFKLLKYNNIQENIKENLVVIVNLFIQIFQT